MADILLIDDDPDQLRLRSLVLERNGHAVRCASTPESALALSRERLPDCTVMDFRLPLPDAGHSLLEELKRCWPAMPIIVLTGYPQDLEGSPSLRHVAELLRKPIRTERLLNTISKLATIVLLGAFSAFAQNKPYETAFDVTSPGAEQLAQIDANALGADWSKPGSEGALAAISVDGGEPHHVWIFGENSRPVTVFLGKLAAGRHTIRVTRDRRSAQAAGLRVNHVRVTALPESSPQSALFAHAPVLFARTNTLGRFSDVPMLAYVTETRDDGLRLLEYTIIFSNEDGGTSSRNLMARWGRVTDIEYVYRVWLDASGKRVKTLIQTRDHKDVAYEGEYWAQHPLLQPVTDNNMVEPAKSGASPLRFHLAPVPADLAHGSRELVMDEAPWTYAVARKELVRENKLRAPMTVKGELIADPRHYVTVELEVAVKDAALQVIAAPAGGGVAHGSASGRLYGYIDRDGWVRTSIEMPPGQAASGLAALAVECMTKIDQRAKQNPATGQCEIKRFGKIFFAQDDGTPAPPLTVEGSATLQAGQFVTFPVKSR